MTMIRPHTTISTMTVIMTPATQRRESAMSSTRYRFAVRVDVIAPNGKRIKDLVIAYPRETKERALQLFERIATGLNQVDLSTAPETRAVPVGHFARGDILPHLVQELRATLQRSHAHRRGVEVSGNAPCSHGRARLRLRGLRQGGNAGCSSMPDLRHIGSVHPRWQSLNR